MTHELLFHRTRDAFPALAAGAAELPRVFFDGPAGTQVPTVVLEAMRDYLVQCNANRGGLFSTSRESDRRLDQTQQAAADFVGSDDADCVYFGPNMTSLTFTLARALSRTWDSQSEVIVTRLEHDANFTPWVTAANDADAKVHYVDVRPEDCTLDMKQFHGLLSSRTTLVAVGYASNAVGTVNPVAEICRAARAVGARSFVDAVHFAPHRRLDVQSIGCDWLACSAYKFFGPHLGLVYGRREVLDETRPYKLRPAPDSLPGRWMSGTQSHEAILGTMAAIDYLADIGRAVADDPQLSRRVGLDHAFQAIDAYEMSLFQQLLDGLNSIADLTILGITDPDRFQERVPTVAFRHQRLTSKEIAKRLGDRGIHVWHGNYYALPLTEYLQMEPEGMVRVGIVHYNTSDEVDYLLEALRDVIG